MRPRRAVTPDMVLRAHLQWRRVTILHREPLLALRVTVDWREWTRQIAKVQEAFTAAGRQMARAEAQTRTFVDLLQREPGAGDLTPSP